MTTQRDNTQPAGGSPVERWVGRLVALVRTLEQDHGPGGWPAVEMATLSGLADEVDRLSSERDVQDAAIACLRADLRECAIVRDADIELHADAMRCALEALDYCIEESAELLNERAAQWGEYRKDRQAAMAETLERHRAVAERLRAMLRPNVI